MRRERFREKHYEDFVYILDYLPYGHGGGYPRRRISGPIAQAVGEKYFMLLELRVIEGLDLKVGERISVRGGLESELVRVLGRIPYDDLTTSAKAELPNVIKIIIERRESEFVNFFNTAQPLTKKMHSLELLHGIGKKTLWKILEERKRKPFTSFKDIYERVKIDPTKLLIDRIIEELKGEERHYLFVRPFFKREKLP